MGIKKYCKKCVAFALVFVFILQLAQSASPVMAETSAAPGSSGGDISAASAGNTTTAAAEKTALVWVFDDTDEHGDPAPLYIDPENYDEATAFMDGVKVTDPYGNEIENGLTMEVDIGGFSVNAEPGKMFTVTYKASHADWKNATITRQAGIRPTAETTNPTETTPTTPAKTPSIAFTFANVDENGKPKPLYINPTTYDETNRLQIFMNGVTVTDENGNPVENGLTIEVDIGTFTVDATPGEMFEIKYKATHTNGLTATATRQAAVQLPRGGLARTAYTVSTFAQLKSAINGAGTGAHTITVTANFDFTETLTIPANKQFTITGSGSQILSAASSLTGRHFVVNGANASLTIGNGITLQGRTSTVGGGVDITNGTFIMDGTSVVTKVFSNVAQKGAIGVGSSNGSFTLKNGTISNNGCSATAFPAAVAVVSATSP